MTATAERHAHCESCVDSREAAMERHNDHAHHGHGSGGALVTSAQATLHCLTGCVIGEVAGLAIGVTLGIGVWPTIMLATTLSYISGFTLGLTPVMRRQNKSFLEALKLIWIGEAVSIGVMEIAMNATDYAVGGMNAAHIFAPSFWYGLAAAVPAGFLAAWPVNWWLLKRDLKKCH
ncbi:MAG: DUF4396 domain-containing protein [Pseudomonadota bacterium]|nr:DUF4396 domain-containing protein [Pseudomonadota bacterium]